MVQMRSVMKLAALAAAAGRSSWVTSRVSSSREKWPV